MSDRRARLEALASKRKNTSEQAPAAKRSKGTDRPSTQKAPAKRTRKAPKPKEILSDEEDEEEDSDEDEEESDEEEEKPRASKSKPTQHRKVQKKATKESDGEASEEDKDAISEEELQAIDTSAIIKGGRRTRGKKIDYKQFGADPEDED
ncbi:hypothetical protein BDF14DRAFT_1881044 [Spinellus fusiger]|nr:hypothetical protein BDF14DRAFT_1881044 [Spinellus fusiger]